MTHTNDDSQFDGSGSDLSRRYRQLPVERVPMELDRLILDHARAALTTEPQPAARRSWISWGLPLGLMATALLAATVMLDYSRRSRAPIAETSVTQPESAAAPAPTAESLGVPPAASSEQPIGEPVAIHESPPLPASKQRRADRSGRGPQPSARIAAAAEPQPVPQPAPMIAAMMPAESAPTLSSAPLLETTPANLTSTEPTPQAGTSVEEPSTASDAETQNGPDSEAMVAGVEALRTSAFPPAKRAKAEERLEDIRDMRKTGRKRGADNAWRKFRRDFPGYPVAADDIARPVTD